MQKADYDLIILGGGTSGVSCAISAGKMGLKTLIIEKKNYLGGTQVGGLCTPMMNNISIRNNNFSEDSVFFDILNYLKKYNGVKTFEDNPFWFNPHILKNCYLEILSKYNVDVSFNNTIKNVIISSRNILSAESLTGSYMAHVYVDASGDGVLSKNCGVEFQSSETYQPPSLRFTLKDIDINVLGKYLKSINDPNFKQSNGFIYSHYTWDGVNSDVINNLVNESVKKNELIDTDFNYVQFFSCGEGLLAFNAPRILIKDFNPNDQSKVDFAYNLGLEAISRIHTFLKKRIDGFSNSSILSISDELCIRESNRIKGRYILTKEDILSCIKFDDYIFSSDYPIDIHSSFKGKSVLENINGDFYQAPLDCARPANIDNLFVIGRCISVTREAIGSTRIQPNCMEMGQKVAEYIAKEILNV